MTDYSQQPNVALDRLSPGPRGASGRSVMKSVFESIALAVTSRPKIALIVLAAVTGVLVLGATLLGPQAGNDAFP